MSTQIEASVGPIALKLEDLQAIKFERVLSESMSSRLTRIRARTADV